MSKSLPKSIYYAPRPSPQPSLAPTMTKLKKSPTKLKKPPTNPTPTPTRALAIASFQSALLPQTTLLPQRKRPTSKALSPPPSPPPPPPPPPDAPTTQGASALTPSVPPNEEKSSPNPPSPKHRPPSHSPLPNAQDGGHWTPTAPTALGTATYLSEHHHRPSNDPGYAPAHNPTVVVSADSSREDRGAEELATTVCPCARDGSVGDAVRQEGEAGGFPWGVDVRGGRCWCCGGEVIRGERCGECWAGRVVYL